MHQDSAVSKELLKKTKITDQKYCFWILKIIVFFADIGYLVKLLSNRLGTLRQKNLENISTLVACKKV